MGKFTSEVENIIFRAVQAGKMSGERTAKDAFKATERRLYAIPVLMSRLDDNKERLEEIRKYGPRSRDKSITRFQKSGVRLTPEEIFEAVVMDMEATIAADEYEVEVMSRALDTISDDEYYQTVTGRYITNQTDEEVAALVPCDTSTVWRNRKRLVQKLAVWLYGAEAIK